MESVFGKKAMKRKIGSSCNKKGDPFHVFIPEKEKELLQFIHVMMYCILDLCVLKKYSKLNMVGQVFQVWKCVVYGGRKPNIGDVVSNTNTIY